MLTPDATPDAAPDAALIPGDWSCVDTPWPTTAPDPLTVRGKTANRSALGTATPGLGNATVEVRAFDTDAVLATATTSNVSMTTRGNYSVTIPSGGTAQHIYRKASLTNFLDDYTYEPTPVAGDFQYLHEMQTPGSRDMHYQTAGVTPDPTKGTVQVFVYDCTPGLATGIAGVTVDPPPGSKAVYLTADWQLDPTLTATTSGFQVILFNVPAGPLDLTVHAGPITYRSWPIVVRPDVWTETMRVP